MGMAAHLRTGAWLLSGVGALLILTLPISNGAQLALSGGVIVGMLGVWRFGRGRLARWGFLTLGTMVVCRYMVWRITSTLPPLDQPVNVALGVTLLLAELYCMLILTVSLIVNADPLERPDLPPCNEADLPTVDVFIPTYNEDATILATTLSAAKLLDYPADKLTVWLLDDGGSDQKCADKDATKAAAAIARRAMLGRLCDDLGARYLTRAKNEHAKAGNLNNGLKHATGAIVVVFDADHAPFRNFLRETVGHFALDPKLFLVQTPHVFLNPDPIERNLQTFQRMPSENEMFYSITQRGLDKWNGSFFCGSAALLRREALDVCGGFSGITITEDCETAFDLHSKGWTSVFVDKPMIAGLQPETLESFIGQRSRWCQGMLQLLILKNPVFGKGLKPIQKVAYLSSMTFWLFPAPRLIFTVAPLLHIFFDVKIFVSSMDEAVAYTATYMVVNLMLQNYLYGRFRWPFMSELYEYVQGVYLFKAIVAVVMKPRSPTFNVTAKGISLDKDHLSSLAWPFFAIFGILAVGAATAFYRYIFEAGAELMLIVGLWTTFNLVIAGVALGVVAERREPDRFPRLAVQRCGLLTPGGGGSGGGGGGSGGGRPIPVDIHSVSAGGCSLREAAGGTGLAALALDARCTLTVAALDGTPSQAPMTLALQHRTTIEGATSLGFALVDRTPAASLALADLMYGDPGAMQRFIAKRRTHMNLLRGIAQFVSWGVTQPVRAFGHLLPLARTLAAAPTANETKPIAAPQAAVTMPAAEAPAAPILAPAPLVEAPVVIAFAANCAEPVATLEGTFDALASLLDATPGPAPLVAEAKADAPVIVPADWRLTLLAMANQATNRGADTAVAAPSSIAA